MNFESFVARLTARRISNFSTYGLWALGDALENEPDHRATEYRHQSFWLDRRIPFAAQWIEISGSNIFQHSKGRKDNGGGNRVKRKGIEFKGFSPERWAFWKQSFKSISTFDQTDATTQRIADETGELMEKLEGLDMES